MLVSLTPGKTITECDLLLKFVPGQPAQVIPRGSRLFDAELDGDRWEFEKSQLVP